MSFPQRLVNSLLTGAYLLFRRLYILPRTEAMLQEVFPQENIPSLDELGQNIGTVQEYFSVLYSLLLSHIFLQLCS